MIDNKQVKIIKQQFPHGTKIRLIFMNDFQAVPSGSIGTVDFVDDIGTIHMIWDNGSTLGLVYGIDKFEIIKERNKKRSDFNEKEI